MEDRDRSIEVARRQLLEIVRLSHDAARDIYRADPGWRRKTLSNAHARVCRVIDLAGEAQSALMFK